MKLFVILKCVIVFTQIFALPVEENAINSSDEVSFETENEDADEIENISRHKKSHPTICVEIKPSVNNERPFVMCKNNYQSNGYSPQYSPQNNGYPPQNTGYPPQNTGYSPQNNGYSPQNNGYQSRSYGIPMNRYNPQTYGNPSYSAPSGYQKSGYVQTNNYSPQQYYSPPVSSYRQQRPTEYRSSYGYDQRPPIYSPYSPPQPQYSPPQPQYSPNYNTNSYKPPQCGSSLLVGCQPRVIPVGCNSPPQPSYSPYSSQPVPTDASYYTEQPQPTYHPQYPQPVLNDVKTIPQNYRSNPVNESSLSSVNTIQASNNVSSSTQNPQKNDLKDDGRKVTSIEKEKATLEQETLNKYKEMKTKLIEANNEASSLSSSNSIPGVIPQGPLMSQQTNFYTPW